MLTIILLIFLYMCLVWVWYRLTNNPSVVDVAWAFGITWVGLAFLTTHAITPRILVFAAVLILWGFRLGFYLYFTRIHKGIVDKRYLTLSQDWQINPRLGFFLNFLLQGFLIFCVAVPFYFAAITNARHPNLLEIIGLAIAIFGIVFETMADQQLQQFKHQHPGKVCDSGLWQHSRHPNYFFEWLIWCGFCLLGLRHFYGLLGFISPITLAYLMIYITAPLTELGSLKARGEQYRIYQAKTPMFFPKFFK